MPRISVCIPAYNRVEVLPELLDSILAQDYADYEIVICEDSSPQRDAIRGVVERYANSRIHLFENEKNLGYDGNLRRTIERATGDYCFFMGNDDLMCAGALRTVADGLSRHDAVGVVLRSWASFRGTPDNVVSTSRYFDGERFFPAGAETATTFYRRSVVIPGMVLHRAKSVEYATDRFDGTTLYQLHLVSNILLDMNGLYLPQILVLYRQEGVPDFGNSEAERGKFVPNERTPEGSLYFVRSILDIARNVDAQRHVPIYRGILKDLGNYSYPILAIQSKKGFRVFTRYAVGLAKAGLSRSVMFYAWFVLLLLFREERINRWIEMVKQRLGRTPSLGGIYQGVKRS